MAEINGGSNIPNIRGVREEFGISTNKQNEVAKTDAMDTLQKMLTGKAYEDGVVTAQEEQEIASQLEYYESQFKNGSGEAGLGNVLFGERFMNMADSRIEEILSSGPADTKANKYIKELQHERTDNLKQSGYKGGYSNVKFGVQTGHNVNVLDSLPEDQKNKLQPSLNKTDTDKILKNLGFDANQREYDANSGAYERTYMNEYGENVRNFVKILENPETKQQYFVMTDIVQGENENDFRVSTRSMGIQKNADGLELIDNTSSSNQPGNVSGESTATNSLEKYNALNDDQKKQVEDIISKQDFKHDYQEYKEQGAEMFNGVSEMFQRTGTSKEVADGFTERYQENISLIQQADSSNGKITPELKANLEKAGISLENLSDILGKEISINNEDNRNVDPSTNNNILGGIPTAPSATQVPPERMNPNF